MDIPTGRIWQLDGLLGRMRRRSTLSLDRLLASPQNRAELLPDLPGDFKQTLESLLEYGRGLGLVDPGEPLRLTEAGREYVDAGETTWGVTDQQRRVVRGVLPSSPL